MRSHHFRSPAEQRRGRYHASLPHIGSITGIFALAILGLGIFVTAQSAQAAPSLHTMRMPPTSQSIGSPAIRLLKTDGGPITVADVVNYVQMEGMPRTLGPRTPISAIQAQLLTSAQISARLHGESTGFPDTTPLWYVQMLGAFVFAGPPGVQAITAHVGYQVFDPTSGNLVMFGGLG